MGSNVSKNLPVAEELKKNRAKILDKHTATVVKRICEELYFGNVGVIRGKEITKNIFDHAVNEIKNNLDIEIYNQLIKQEKHGFDTIYAIGFKWKFINQGKCDFYVEQILAEIIEKCKKDSKLGGDQHNFIFGVELSPYVKNKLSEKLVKGQFVIEWRKNETEKEGQTVLKEELIIKW